MNVDPLIERQREIVLKALEKPTDVERAAYVDGACGNDLALRREVELLLQHDTAGSFLERPAMEAEKITPSGGVVPEAPGTTIGRYKLLQKIGEGGCGVVYMAEQEQPVRRRVALKIIKLGMDTKSVVARFEAERQALALMDHPNIAKVHDAGATETGRPYFVMELVRGPKITDYCDQKNLSTPDRLDLFVKVCQAVQHAHQKGVIHRDLKPSNILVTVIDGLPVPKVIDFGIAKATSDQRLTDKTVFTAFEQFIGTPAYMSPEQAEISGVDVDTRSDIYSLGVLLYELLTGKTPFDAVELLKIGLDEMRRTIREKEPARPSLRVSTLGADELTTTAKRRGLEPPKLTSMLRGDLDWIVMKCLEKDRARRYETANGLAMDVQRHLDSEPVVACPPSAVYRFQKLVRRNRLAFAAATLTTAALLIGLGVSTWMFMRERHAAREQVRLRGEADSARNQAKAQAAAAGAQARKSREISQFLKDMLQSVGPSVAQGRDTTLLREVLDKTAERLRKDMFEEPEAELELRDTLQNVYGELSLYDKMEEMARASVQLARERLGPDSLWSATALYSLGWALNLRHKEGEAETALRDAIALFNKLPGDHSPDIARCLAELGGMLTRQGKLVEAERLMREALERMKRATPGDDYTNTIGHITLEFAGVLFSEQKLPEAEKLARKAIDLSRQLPDRADLDGAGLNLLSIILLQEGKYVEAEPMLRGLLQAAERLKDTASPNYAILLNNLGDVLTQEGKLEEAEASHRRALAINAGIFGKQGLPVALTLTKLGRVLLYERKLAEAEDVDRTSLEIYKKRLEDCANPSLAMYRDVISPVEGLWIDLKAEGKTEAASNLKREAVAFARKAIDLAGTLDLETPDVRLSRGALQASLGQWEKASEDLTYDLNLRPDNGQVWHFLAATLIQQGRIEDYRLHCRKEFERFGGASELNDVQRVLMDSLVLPGSGVDLERLARMAGLVEMWARSGDWFQTAKSLLEYRQGNFAQAVAVAEKSLSSPDANGKREVSTLMILAMAQHHLGRSEDARGTIDQGIRTAEAKLPRLEDGEFGGGWAEWVFAQALIREARALINGPAPEAVAQSRMSKVQGQEVPAEGSQASTDEAHSKAQ